MKIILLILSVLVLSATANAQFTYKIKADSVRITNDSCSAELILENSTKGIKGFLYNRGNGRTEFRAAGYKLGDTAYVIGEDTLRFSGGGYWELVADDIRNTNSGNVIINGKLSAPGTGAGSERFGAAANSSTYDSAALLGHSAVASGHKSVAVGAKANAGGGSVAVGFNSRATGTGSTIVGDSTSDNNQNNVTAIGRAITQPSLFSGGSNLQGGLINIGQGNRSNSYTNNLLIGKNLTPNKNNQVLIGNGTPGQFLTEMVLGSGSSNNSAAAQGAFIIKGTDGDSTNRSGMPLSFRTGRGTGTGTGGVLSFFTSPAGASGNTLNPEYERMRINQIGQVGIGTAGPSSHLHVYGTNTRLHIEGDAASYYPGILITSAQGTSTINNYGINSMHGTYIIRETAANKRVAIGTTVNGAAAVSTDSLKLTFQVVSAYNQDTDIFRVSRNTNATFGSVTADGVFNIDKIGRVGIGNNSPTASLHVKAGNTSAGSAPLKFTSGSLLTSPENGSVEYDGTNYYATSGGNRYALAKTLTATSILDFPSTASSGSQDLTITITGAADGDVVSLGVPSASVIANGSYTAWVSASNTVTVRFSNNDSSNAADPASGSFRVSVLKY